MEAEARPPSPVSLLGLGKSWTRVGHGVLALAVIVFVLNFTLHPIVPTQPIEPLAKNALAPAGTTPFETSKGRVALPPGFRAEVRGDLIQAYPVGYRMIGGAVGGAAIRPTPLGALGVFLLVFSPLAAFVWTLVDVVDRRRRFVWLLPMFLCPLIGALQALPLALYIFFGRVAESPESSVK